MPEQALDVYIMSKHTHKEMSEQALDVYIVSEHTHRIDGCCGRCVHDNDTGASIKHSSGQVGADILTSHSKSTQS